MAYGDEFLTNRLTVAGPTFTGAHPLQFPESFVTPGSMDVYRGYFGMTSITGYQKAALSVGVNLDSPLGIYGAPGTPHFFDVGTILTLIGDHRVVGRSSVAGAEFRTNVANAHIIGSTAQLFGKTVNVTGTKNTITGVDLTIAAPNLTINGLSWNGYVVEKLKIAGKGFDIPHPTKPDTHRLRYICLEGPEVGTYLRGKLNNTNVIELPDYWTESFIDLDSITVNLTPVGNYQELFIKEIKDGKILVGNNSASKIHCHYTVFAERKTRDKLQVEYEGQTPADYPGDNSEYSLAGWDYDRR